MRICHIALGGCVTGPKVPYGITEDTGGHIAYILGAAGSQAKRPEVTSVEILTRCFDDPGLGEIFSAEEQIIGPKLRITRLKTENSAYLSKEGLAREIPALVQAFIMRLRNLRCRPDVIHAHFADAAMLARAAQKYFGIPFVYTPHSLALDKPVDGSENKKKNARLPRMRQERDALYASDAIIVSSLNEAVHQVGAYGTRAKVEVIAPGTNFASTSTELESSAFDYLKPFLKQPDKPLIFAMARPVYRKNLETLAKVYGRSTALQRQANLVILAGQHGRGSRLNDESRDVLNRLHCYLSSAKYLGCAALPPYHNQELVSTLYAHARNTKGVFVNPAFHEPFGLTVLEAAAHGVPVIATKNGGPADIISRLQHGLCVDPRVPEQLETALHTMLECPKTWTEASTAGLHVHEVFNWSDWSEAVSKIYRRIKRTKKSTRLESAYLLACDIDNTLTGCADGADAFRKWADKKVGTFAVATGRRITEAKSVLAQWELPTPDIFVTSVGSEIYFKDRRGRLNQDTEYAEYLAENWYRKAVLEIVRRNSVALQLDVDQRTFKVGCFGSIKDRNFLAADFAQAGLDVQVIISHNRFIDILPSVAGKYAALRWAAAKCDIDHGAIIVAGDSGNDEDMLTQAPRAIMVANALPEISNLSGRSNVYHAKKPFAAGVMEGLAHYRIAQQPTVKASS